MKIKRIEIEAFGKFKNFSLDFSDGFNLIFGKNEAGKSTVMAFICLMLYGGAGKASRTDISGNFRKKYAPRSGEKMAGDMEIACGGRNFLIHKEFRASAKTDKVVVTDTDTGNKISLPPDMEIGKYFLGIDYTAFEKSIFGASAENFAGTESGDLAERLSNLAESGDESVSSKKVSARIESAMEALVRKRSKGEIDLAKDRADELSEYIRKVNDKIRQRESLSLEYKKIEEEIAVLTSESKQAREVMKNDELRRQATALKKLAELYTAVKKTEKILLEKTKGCPIDEVLCECDKKAKAVEVAKDILLKIEKPVESKIVSEEDMREYFRLVEAKKVESEMREKALKSRKLKGVLTVLGFAVMGIGIVAGLFSEFAFMAVPVGLALTISCLFGRKSAEDYSMDSAEIKLAELFAKRNCTSSEDFEKAFSESITFREKECRYAEAENEYRMAEAEFIEYIGKFISVLDYDEAQEYVSGLKELKIACEKAVQNASSYASVCGIEERESDKLLNLAQDIEKGLTNDSGKIYDADEIDRELHIKNAKLLEIRGLLGDGCEDIAPAVRELEEIQQRIKEMENYYRDLAIAREVLLEAEDEMRRSFAPALKSRASEILSGLTGGKYINLSMDKEYEIEVKPENGGGYISRQYLSRGTCAQSYLALRIALCEMLSENEAVPVFLDDVLADYDDERASEAIEFLKNYVGCNGQILFFTCHSRHGGINERHNILE